MKNLSSDKHLYLQYKKKIENFPSYKSYQIIVRASISTSLNPLCVSNRFFWPIHGPSVKSQWHCGYEPTFICNRTKWLLWGLERFVVPSAIRQIRRLPTVTFRTMRTSLFVGFAGIRPLITFVIQFRR